MKKKSKAALEREIRRLVDDVNDRIFEYENLTESNADINPLFIDAFTDLYEKGLSGVRMSDFGMRITPALYTKVDGKKKTYEMLQEQRDQLKEFIEMDIWSPIAKEEYEGITEQKYQTFLANVSMDEDEFSRGDWESMFDAFSILQKKHAEYGYGDREAANSYRNTYMKLDRKQRRTFGDVLEETLKELEGKEKDAQIIIGKVEEKFGLNR